MSIKVNDGILAQAAKPLDIKTYVGPQDNFEFNTKEDLVAHGTFILFEGMEIKAFENSVWKTYRLEDDLSTWIELINSSDVITIVQYHTLCAVENTDFTVPDKSSVLFSNDVKLGNSNVTINGITIINGISTLYIMSDFNDNGTIKTKIEFQFVIEIGDDIGVLRY